MDLEKGLPQGKESPSPQHPATDSLPDDPSHTTPSTFRLIITILGRRLLIPSYDFILDQLRQLAILPMCLCGIFSHDPATNVWRCSILVVAVAVSQLEEFLAGRRAAAFTRCARENRGAPPLESTPLCIEVSLYPNGVPKGAVREHYVWYRDTEYGILNGTNRRIALDKLRARSLEGMVAQYSERERIRDSQSTLRQRLAFKWYSRWSAIRTRAAIDDVVQEYCNELPSDASRISERDRRHFVNYTANMLEYRYLQRPARLISSALLYGTIFFIFFLPDATATTATLPWIIALPWVHSTLALTLAGLIFAIWHFTNLYRWTELLGAPLKYTDPQAAAMLHTWWSDWQGGGRRLGAAKMWNAAITGRGPEARATWVRIVALVAVADASGVV